MITLLSALVALSAAQPGQWHSITPSDGEDGGVNTHDLNGVYCLTAANCWAVGDESVIVHWDGATWRRVESPVPDTVDLFDVFMAAANDGWIVGSTYTSGLGTYPTILHWDGTSWIDVVAHLGGTPFGNNFVGDLRSVWFVSASNGWAVGADGAGSATVDNIIHITGSWPAVTLAIVNPGGSAANLDILNSIHMFSATNGWAVGDGPIIYRTTDGATWSGIPVADIPAAADDLNGVYMADGGGNVWAVGDTDTIIKYSGVGTTWSDDGTGTLTTGVDYEGIWMVSPTDGWIVGEAEPLPDIAAIIQRRSPGIWVLLTPPQRPTDLDLLDVMMVSSSNGWAVGEDGVILRYSGEWHSQTSPTDVDLRAVHMITPSLGWAVGDSSDGGKIFKWNGASWDLYPRPSIINTIELHSVHFDSGGTVGFIVGVDTAGPTALIWKWDAASSSWGIDASVPVAIGGLNDVFVVSTTDAWAVGDADPGPTVNVIRWQAGIWTQTETGIPATVTEQLNSVWFADANRGFAVGDEDGDTTPNGPVLLRWISTTWVQDNPPPEPGPNGPDLNADLYSVHCLDVSNCWAVGETEAGSVDAAIVRWDGPANRWWRVSAATIPLDLDLNEVWMVSAGEGWAVGNSGTLPDNSMIAYWDAFSWRETEPDPPTLTVDLNSVCMVSSSDGWAVGDEGRMLRFGPFPVPYLTTYTITASVTSTQTVTGTSTTHVATTTISSSTVTTVTSTATQTTTSFTTVTGTLTPTPAPIPGFPMESIIIGILGGAVALTLLRRRR